MNLPHFKFYDKKDVLSLTRLRRFETKLGERLLVLNDDHSELSFQKLDAEYVVFGIPEDLGVQGNEGVAGTGTAWLSFLDAFLNIQSNDFLNGDEVAVIGHFDFTDLQHLIDSNAATADERTAAYRHAVTLVDEEVEKLVKVITASGRTAIAIGGGHNNAYPMIKGAAKGLLQSQKIQLSQINCINLDAHADYRPLEGRHSGNAFRYAEEDGFLQKYCVVGLQENYLQQNVWMDIVNNPFFDCITYEDIFVHEKRTFHQSVSHAIGFTDDNYTGIELDLDCVENILSSAVTPSGITVLQARQFVNLCAATAKVAYLHISEGAARLANGSHAEGTGKLISFLVSDFIKMHHASKE